MSDSSLDELMVRWHDARRQRPDVTAEEICRDCPEMVASLKEQLQTLAAPEAPRGTDPFATLPPASADPCATPDPFATQAPTAPSADPVLLPGAPAIAGYHILAELGRGGMGVVYLAVQRATKRRVALKVLLHGAYASDRQRRRFEREVDLAASLRHPHIVTVYDSGTTDDGLPFCVMEYIQGRSLDEQLRIAQPTRAERLKLFAAICAAVSAAHQRGIIHRDLKPANIRIDADGAPHVLDFGLAKTVGPSADGEAPTLTHTGEFLGTLAYAAPEQAVGDPNLIDVRTDVYALGIILYEMLVGQHPHPLSGNLSELLKALTEREPQRPSARHPDGGIDEALDAIVMKALAREREQRYQSAGALAEDVGHFLAGEPIQARPPSLAFLLRRWLRSNQQTTLRIVLIGVVCGGLAAAGIGASILPLLNLCADAYHFLPSLERPWLATDFTLPFAWLRALSLFGSMAFVSMGVLTAVFIRPQRRSEDVLAGLATGIVGGVTAFVVTLGWVSVIALTLNANSARDLLLLRHLSVDRAAPEVLHEYPDLAVVPPEHRAAVLVEKVVGEVVIGVARGLWLGVLFVVVSFGASSVLGTLLAGTLLRRHGRVGIAVMPYLEATLPCAWIIIEVYLALFLPHRHAGANLWSILLFLGLGSLAVVGVARAWPWPVRGGAYTAVLVGLVAWTTHSWNWRLSAAVAVATVALLGWWLVWRKQDDALPLLLGADGPRRTDP